ncbi:sialidase family protein [Fodinicola acaciae]|uniref:sialidase family protein n=1 Tax=Fodinicola acaciae TaxID=2681555 RepID=UPI0013D6A39E|nr:sialidase family protein [Fodinicola acaciae]
MSKLDFEDVRAAVREQTTTPPGFGALWQAGRRRHRRRSAMAIAAVAAAVVVVAGGTVVLVNRPPAVVLPVAPASVLPTPSQPPASHGQISGAAVPLDQIDGTTTTSVLGPLITYGVGKIKGGGVALVRTLDGGQSWQAWRIPGAHQPMLTAVRDVVLILNDLVRQDGDTFKNGATYLSRDGGQSWTTLVTGKAIDQAPAGAYVTAVDGRLAAVDPASGSVRSLVHQPPDADLGLSTGMGITGIRQATDGSIWVNRGQPAKFADFPSVSRDGGRTWNHARSLITDEKADNAPNRPYEDTYDGRTAYQFKWRQTPNRTAVYATGDGGRTWSPVADQSGGLVNPVVLKSGAIVASDFSSGTIRLSTNGGRTFTTVPSFSGGEIAHALDSDAVVAQVQRGSVPVVLWSLDGAHWWRVADPPFQRLDPLGN